MIVVHAWMFFSFRREIATGYPDFTSLYTGGKCILQGHGRQLYDLETQFHDPAGVCFRSEAAL